MSTSHTSSSWRRCVLAAEAFLRQPTKADLLSERYVEDGWDSAEHRRFRRLFNALLRHWFELEERVQHQVRRSPRPRLRALLYTAGAELLISEESNAAQVIDHAVREAKAMLSQGESGLVNAVLRRWSESGMQPDPVRAHPEWLRVRWEQAFGKEAAEQLLHWNQGNAETYVHLSGDAANAAPEGLLQLTSWPNYYTFDAARFSEVEALLKRGIAYIQDPSASVPVELMAPRPGETILDLCSAPGGKLWQMAQRMKKNAAGEGSGTLVAVDLPGPRLERLRENMARLPKGLSVRLLPSDALALETDVFTAARCPVRYDAVLVDVPCSNTGVLRRRPDVKIRLRPEDFESLPPRQLEWLSSAARWVRPGGRLIYSTCSVDPEENDQVIERFLAGNDAFVLNQKRSSLPWRDGHDGGFAALLERKR